MSRPSGDAPGAPAATSEAPAAASSWPIDRRFLLVLVVLALVTRLVWVLWIHPPGDYVFSDMRKYVDRAEDLALYGIHPSRPLAWQVWGTHYLLAIPLAFVSPWISCGLYVLVAAMWLVPDRRIEKTIS